MDNLWSRRATNPSKLSLSTNTGPDSPSGRNTSSFKRFGSDSSSIGKFGSGTTPGGLVTPTSAASNAFGLGSGAFASFGPAKTPKTPGNPFDTTLGAGAKTPGTEKSAKDGSAAGAKAISKATSSASLRDAGKQPAPSAGPPVHQLRNSWVFWFRPPISKANGFIEYEKTLHPIATVEAVEQFFGVYRHLKRPSALPLVSDYHLFKKGIRPIWEDEENKNGGKWVVRLRKGVADRYWEDLLFAIIGDQFGEASEEVCGVVLSVRNGEDILSIWARANGQRVLKIRETMRRILAFPPDTKLEWKSHDSSIQQRNAIEESRREKAANAHHHGDKRSHNKQQHLHNQQQQHHQQQQQSSEDKNPHNL
ncbi:hypothetical protein VTJ49DRAFT_2485 [Mycothermus thermophilus]|uniref:Uncharacterized protein n=1 Tax=Humicola insolens TaxID=85995 RepID=A0ABR3VA12_HUMIN